MSLPFGCIHFSSAGDRVYAIPFDPHCFGHLSGRAVRTPPFQYSPPFSRNSVCTFLVEEGSGKPFRAIKRGGVEFMKEKWA